MIGQPVVCFEELAWFGIAVEEGIFAVWKFTDMVLNLGPRQMFSLLEQVVIMLLFMNKVISFQHEKMFLTKSLVTWGTPSFLLFPMTGTVACLDSPRETMEAAVLVTAPCRGSAAYGQECPRPYSKALVFHHEPCKESFAWL